MSVICHDCFTAGVSVLFGEGLQLALCVRISCHLGEGGQMQGSIRVTGSRNSSTTLCLTPLNLYALSVLKHMLKNIWK